MEFIDKVYKDRCSYETVCSNSEGFFNTFYETVKKTCGDYWINNVFGKNTTDQDKYKVLFSDPVCCDIIVGTLDCVQPVFEPKNPTISRVKRDEGDKRFAEMNYHESMMMYSQAVLSAPVQDGNDGDFLLALWGRSAALIEMKMPTEALDDLQQIRKIGVPSEWQGDFYWRTAKCYILKSEIQKAKISYGLAEKFLAGHKKKLVKVRKEMKAIESTITSADVCEEKAQTFPKLSEDYLNEQLLDVKHDDRQGWHVVAKNDIKCGDLLVKERPTGACLRPDFYGKYCLNCLEKLLSPIGCNDCCGVAFCSVACRDIACNGFHKFDCRFTKLLIGSGMSVLSFLTLRIILDAGTPTAALEKANKLLDGLCMLLHFRTAEELLQRHLMGSFLVQCLRKSGFFGKSVGDIANPTEIEVEIGVAIGKLLQALQFNAHEIYVTKYTTKNVPTGAKIVNIGVAVYPKSALFNHDCHPTMCRYFEGTNMVLAAIRPVRRGDPIGENYGLIYDRHDRDFRQLVLQSRYWFNCECRACAENWPTSDVMQPVPTPCCRNPECGMLFKDLLEASTLTACPACNELLNFSESLKIYNRCKDLYVQAEQSIEIGDAEEAMSNLRTGIDMFYEVAAPPDKETAVAEGRLRSTFSTRGNVEMLTQ